MSRVGRVGVVGRFEQDDFGDNIASTLEALGHEVVRLDPPSLRYKSKVGRSLVDVGHRHRTVGPLLESALLHKIADSNVELLITVVSLRPETVAALRRSGVAVALWFPDAVTGLPPYWMFSAPYSALFFKDPLLVERVAAQLRTPTYYLPEACNPNYHYPIEGGQDVAGRVVVVGNLHPLRISLLERLIADGVPLSVYGSVPASVQSSAVLGVHERRYVRGTAKSAVFRGAGAVLNNLMPSEMDGMNCRLFEATAAGGAVLTEWRPALDSLFDVGVEVIAYREYDELLQHVRDLLASPQRAREIGNAASTRALRSHTYVDRITEMLERLL